MYIPKQPILRDDSQLVQESKLLNHNLELEVYYLDSRSAVESSSQDTSFSVPSVLIAISVVALVSILLIIS